MKVIVPGLGGGRGGDGGGDGGGGEFIIEKSKTQLKFLECII